MSSDPENNIRSYLLRKLPIYPLSSRQNRVYDAWLEPSAIAQFISLKQCSQFYKYEFDDEIEREARKEKDYKEAFEPLSTLLGKDGRDFEDEILEAVARGTHTGEIKKPDEDDGWEGNQKLLVNTLCDVAKHNPGSSPEVITQLRLAGVIGVWGISGDADLVYLWHEKDHIRIRVIDIKAAHEEKTYQQAQVAIYTLLLRQFLNEIGLGDCGISVEIEGGVIHRDEDITQVLDFGPSDIPLDDGTSEFQYHTEDGDVVLETYLSTGTSDELPEFDLDARETDIERLLSEGGRFDLLEQTDEQDIQYQLESKCSGCAYREACYTNAIENVSTSMLGISPGEQALLEEHDIETLDDLARLAYVPDNPRPIDYDGMDFRRNDTVNSLKAIPGIGTRLPRLVQHAQTMLGKLRPGSSSSYSSRGLPWIYGSGKGSLPADNPPFEADLAVPQQKLIRCYLHVQHDHRHDRISMVSGYVTATAYSGNGNDPITFSTLISTNETEADVLEQSLADLFNAIRTVATDIDCEHAAYPHLYLYTAQEKDALLDSLERCSDVNGASAMRDLLGLSGSVDQHETDQSMLSIVQNELHERVAFPTPNTGLIPAYHEYYPKEDDLPYSDSGWEYTRSDGVTVNLKEVFWHKIFDYRVPYQDDGDQFELVPGGDIESNKYYPSRVRQAQIPLEYVWVASGRIDNEWIREAKDEFDSVQQMDSFMYFDQNGRTYEITNEDVEMLGQKFAHAVAHIERCFQYRDLDAEKSPISTHDLPTFSSGESSIGRACREFLDMEFAAQKQETHQHYSLPLTQRIQCGDTIPMVVKSIEERGNGIRVDGILAYDGLFKERGEQVANACRKKGSDGATGGSWMVATPLDSRGRPKGSDKPEYIERGVPVTIDSLDIPNRQISLSLIHRHSTDREYVRWHRYWTTDPEKEDDSRLLLEENTVLALDPQLDDGNSQKSLDMLEYADCNPLVQSLEQIMDGSERHPTTDAFDAESVSEFHQWLDSNYFPPPNEKQADFLKEVNGKFSLLQGPPGTGKTSGALATTLLSRVYSYEKQNKSFAGVVSGASNKAVDETLEDTANCLAEFCADDSTSALSDFQLIRLTTEEPDDPLPNVEYLDYYNDDEAMVRLMNRVSPNEHLSMYSDENNPHTLIFTTPGRFYNMMKILSKSMGLEDPEGALEKRTQLFDLLAVDEGSMMQLPQFLLVGAFLEDHAQVLVAGDQRQMPPVLKHDWEDERRRTVTELSPHLSTLDYFRLLRGDEIENIEMDQIAHQPSAEIPLTPLEVTYRCHEVVADFLNRNLYEQDGITYRAVPQESYCIDDPSPTTDGIRAALDVDAPLVLILHSEDDSRQSNSTEAAIASALVYDLSLNNENAGVVTPHNAQRGFLRSHVNDIEVDTVERYQGGQRDTIMVSATASDPDFLESESDFILNPNRLNVAMSRMKKKLIVMASKRVFEMMPGDVREYERALLWKGLYRDLDVLDRDPAWEGSIDEFLGNSSPKFWFDKETDIEVYRLQARE
ncbi:AAA domain-containing protein [Haladaptatus pallidirubidus]|nr:AAA domain-containing protein [Haladaptatus pallidirubidus]